VFVTEGFEEISVSEWEKVMAINLKGTFLCCQAVLFNNEVERERRIITLTSLAAKTGGILASTHYSTSRPGVTSLTKSLAKYVVKVIRFLTSNVAKYITGEIIDVDDAISPD